MHPENIPVPTLWTLIFGLIKYSHSSLQNYNAHILNDHLFFSLRATFSCDGTGAHPCKRFIGFTDHNLHVSSSVRYIGSAQGMSSILNFFFGLLKTRQDL